MTLTYSITIFNPPTGADNRNPCMPSQFCLNRLVSPNLKTYAFVLTPHSSVMSLIRIKSLVEALAALSLSDNDDDDTTVHTDLLNAPQPSTHPTPPGTHAPPPRSNAFTQPFPLPIAQPVFTLTRYQGDALLRR